MRSNTVGHADSGRPPAVGGVVRLPGAYGTRRALARWAAGVVLDVGLEPADTAALVAESYTGGPAVVVARSNGDGGQVWRFPAAGGGCWNCALPRCTWSAPDINVARLVRAWAAVVAAAELAGAEVEDHYRLQLDSGDGGLLQPHWSSGLLLRDPQCRAHRVRPAPFEQLALLP